MLEHKVEVSFYIWAAIVLGNTSEPINEAC